MRADEADVAAPSRRASLRRATWRNQLISRFELAKIWSTNSKSLISKT